MSVEERKTCWFIDVHACMKLDVVGSHRHSQSHHRLLTICKDESKFTAADHLPTPVYHICCTLHALAFTEPFPLNKSNASYRGDTGSSVFQSLWKHRSPDARSKGAPSIDMRH